MAGPVETVVVVKLFFLTSSSNHSVSDIYCHGIVDGSDETSRRPGIGFFSTEKKNLVHACTTVGGTSRIFHRFLYDKSSAEMSSAR